MIKVGKLVKYMLWVCNILNIILWDVEFCVVLLVWVSLIDVSVLNGMVEKVIDLGG